MNIVEINDIIHEYTEFDSDGNAIDTFRALDKVTLDIKEGDFVAVLGHNGSGKSTLAKHINALLMPTEGTVLLLGRNTKEADPLWEIRRDAGMIFQNPDNQIIGTSIEEDVAFGPENIGVPTEEIERRIEEVLEKVGMTAYRMDSPNQLSGGQKQRVAIAGMLAMKPKCILMDEPTAMLDPAGRKEVLDTVHALNEAEGITVVLITHYMEEAARADKVFVMDGGKLIMQGTPREVFSQIDTLEELHLTVPEVTKLNRELQKAGVSMPDGVLSTDELVEALKKAATDAGIALAEGENPEAELLSEAAQETTEKTEEAPLIELKDASYSYDLTKKPLKYAVKGANLTLRTGEFVAVIGHTGSGKSTMIQFLNGLVIPTEGNVFFNGKNTADKDFSIMTLRQNVGLVFQYPEHQLFETTVLKDVMYGPKNQKLSKEEQEARAKEALRLVEFPEEDFDKSPFDLSGGQKRRVAIAGVLAMKPHCLVLDEPTAGLDPEGRTDLLNLLKRLNEEENITIVLVSHSMEDVAAYAKRVVVMNDGEIRMDGATRQVFGCGNELETMGLSAPKTVYMMKALRVAGFPVRTDRLTVSEARDEILRALRKA